MADILTRAGKGAPLTNAEVDANFVNLNEELTRLAPQVNHIGTPGLRGYGVGIAPSVPSGFSKLAGTENPYSDQYGNYQFSDGSVMVWIPAYYLRIGHVDNPTYAAFGVNSIDTKPLTFFASEAAANAQGYYLHRAFKNNGVNQAGFFRDKYDCSNNSGTASSIALAAPVVSGPSTGQTGFSACTANGQTPANNYGGAIAAAKSRGSRFFPESIFMADALTRISEAHAQAAVNATNCAWWVASGVSAPRGNNNNALRDTSDTSVVFTTAGAAFNANFALTGSGVPFAKTTHNGQANGITDVAGNIWKINIGMTCIAATKTITGATQANPCAITIAGHGYTTGQVAMIESVGGMTQLNSKLFKVTVIDADTFSLDGVDSTAFGAYTSGGNCTVGTWYALKESADIAVVTGGNSGATDHWGATGVAALMDAVDLEFATTYPSNGYAQRYGNGANAVFDMDDAASRARAMLGMPEAGGVSTSGTNLFGQDYYYQYVRNELCVVSRGSWPYGSGAGVRFRPLDFSRAYASYSVGFAAASYL
jgi:hypothetical protein